MALPLSSSLSAVASIKKSKSEKLVMSGGMMCVSTISRITFSTVERTESGMATPTGILSMV